MHVTLLEFVLHCTGLGERVSPRLRESRLLSPDSLWPLGAISRNLGSTLAQPCTYTTFISGPNPRGSFLYDEQVLLPLLAVASFSWLFWLFTLNSCLNPFIYMAFNRELVHTLTAGLSSCCCSGCGGGGGSRARTTRRPPPTATAASSCGGGGTRDPADSFR